MTSTQAVYLGLLALGTIVAFGLVLLAWGSWKDVPIRRKINRWLDPEVYRPQPLVNSADNYLVAKAAIYTAIGSMSRGPGLRLLTEISRELIVDDPRLGVDHAQALVAQISAIAAELTPPEFIFLCLTAIDHTIISQLIGAGSE